VEEGLEAGIRQGSAIFPLPLAGEGGSAEGRAGRGKPVVTLGQAKKLRTNMTDAERRLWYRLRAHRFGGYKFKRQVPIGPYVVDFACIG
jgi:hypothetical protein